MAKILVVDDSPAILRIISTNLRKAGHDVDTADSGSEAMTMVLNGYELLITDIIMPDVTGLELLDIMREVDPDLPVILITAEPTHEGMDAAFAGGAFDYLIKPIATDELIGAVDLALRISPLERDHKQQNEDAALAQQIIAGDESMDRVPTLETPPEEQDQAPTGPWWAKADEEEKVVYGQCPYCSYVITADQAHARRCRLCGGRLSGGSEGGGGGILERLMEEARNRDS